MSPTRRCLGCRRLIGHGSYCDNCYPYHQPTYVAAYQQSRQMKGQLCPDCGEPMETPSLNHVIPAGRGGANDPSNFEVGCLSCNKKKGS